jgi:hypothetical protein
MISPALAALAPRYPYRLCGGSIGAVMLLWIDGVLLAGTLITRLCSSVAPTATAENNKTKRTEAFFIPRRLPTYLRA